MLEKINNIPVCAGIVTYNPDINQLLSCIKSLYNQVDEVIIFDNSSDNKIDIEQLNQVYKLEIYFSNENVGIAKGLNELCKTAEQKGYNWIITMDQDSICELSMVRNLIKYADKDKIGIVAPSVEFWLNEFLITTTKNKDLDSKEIKACITSGSLTNISAWRLIGGFDEWMFIDHVDNEFCTHLQIEGFKIIRTNKAILYQRAGEMHFLKLPLKKTILLPYYSSLRNYYICRNTVYYLRKYRKHINFRHELFAFIYAQIIKIVFEKGRKQSISSSIRGIIDGMKKILL